MGKKSKVLNQISVRYHVVRVFFVIFISWVFMSQISWLVFFATMCTCHQSMNGIYKLGCYTIL